MARRSTPERIFQARRDAIRNTLTGSGMPLETAERWCDAWEIEAAGLGPPLVGITAASPKSVVIARAPSDIPLADAQTNALAGGDSIVKTRWQLRADITAA